MHMCMHMCRLHGEGDNNKSCINIELKEGELTNGSSCSPSLAPTVNNSILCYLFPGYRGCFIKVVAGLLFDVIVSDF